MDIESLRQYCLSLKSSTEDMPFGPDTLVFRVAGKIYALTGLDTEKCQVNLKCDPDYAIELREKHTDIIPGYHMNKKHWNTILIDGTLTLTIIKQCIDDSYDLVVSALTKKDKEIWKNLQ
jgi:predicted DNA-binding protein (MmcQ/YjbR family)